MSAGVFKSNKPIDVHELHRVNRLVVVSNFVMEMRTSASPCIAQVSDNLTAFNKISLADNKLAVVGEHGRETVSMINLYIPTIGRVVIPFDNDTVCCCPDFCTSLITEIYTIMESVLAI